MRRGDHVRMTRSPDLDPIVLARYLSGESTSADVALVQAWAGADPANAARLEELRRAWSSSFPLERPVDVDAAWRNVRAAMREMPSVPTRSTPVAPARGTYVHVLHPGRHQRQRALGTARLAGLAAAAAIVVAGAGLVVRHGLVGNGAGADAAGRTVRDFAAGTGERALVDLPDGTHIVLAPATHLHVSLPNGRSGVRDLMLDGEATFTVTHDPARPFEVHSRYGTTVDVGTSFGVRAYAGEAYRVVVRAGRVALGDSAAPVLVAGDVATRGTDGAMHVAHAQDASGLLDWSDGRLTFEHTRFADLVPELERWYGVRITIASPALRDRFVTGQLDTESREDAMRALGRTLGAQHVSDGSRVTFSLPTPAR